MIIIAVVISIVFVAILGIIIKAYYDDIIELEERILQLEKRLQKSIKDRDDETEHIYDNLYLNNQEIKDLETRIQKLERKKNKNDKTIYEKE